MARACSWFITEVRKRTSLCRCRTNCRTSRSAAEGTQIRGKTILDQQVENVQSIPGVRLLFSHHRRADLRRIAKPKFMAISTEHPFKPLCGDGGFYPHAGWSGKCGIKP